MDEKDLSTVEVKGWKAGTEFISKVGWPIAVGVYFLARDWMFSQALVEQLTKLSIALEQIKQTVK